MSIFHTTTDEQDATLLATINSATTAAQILTALSDEYNAGRLLTAAYADKFDDLPAGAGRQQAIALGVIEVSDLFGNFASLDAAKAVLEKQIDVEHAKFEFINAIDSAEDVDDMVAALGTHVAAVNADRQALITAWDAIEGNTPLDERVAALKADQYTVVLDAIADQLGNAAFVRALASKMLAARDASNGGKFFGVTNIITALDAADDAIAPSSKTVDIDEDAALITVDINAQDVPNSGLTYSIKSTDQAELGDVELADGKFTYKAHANANGKDTFTIVISDNEGGSVEQVVTVNIKAINDAVTAPATATVTTDEDTAFTGEIGAADVDGDKLTYTVKDGSAPKLGAVAFADGKFTYTPTADLNGTDTFTIVIDDGNGGVTEQVVNVTVNAVNDAPKAATLTGTTVTENATVATVVGTLSTQDVDAGDTFTYELIGNAAGAFRIEGDKITVANSGLIDFEAKVSHDVVVRAKDAAGTFVDKTFTINVTDVLNEINPGSSANDIMTGGAGKDTFTGGAGNDVINAGAGVDKVDGGAGNDKIAGGLGKDSLTGGSGKDIFIFDSKPSSSNVDTVKDFKVKDDSIYLDNAVFTKLGSGTLTKPKQLKKDFFSFADKVADNKDHVIYDQKTGVLSYDTNGIEAGGRSTIAKLSKNLDTMSYKDFFVI
jgi:Ca2+-binding RTX toxin-like protein